MPKRKLADVSGCKTRVVVADWALARSPKLYADLPVTLTQQKPPKKHQDYWFNFDSVLHPLALVDSEGSVVRTNEALTETITWTALTGSVTEEKFTSKPDKEGLYWFKKTDAYVLGSFAFSFSCANLSNCEPLIRYIPIIPGEGVAAEAAPSTNAISLLPRESRLEWGWMGKSAAVSLGERQLALSRYLWTSLRSDHKGSERTSFRLPPFRPSASDLLVTATLKSGAHLSRSPSDASLFCESMRILFDSIFESAVLFPSEKEFYQRKGILTIMTDSRSRPCSRPCDMFGGMHLLRFLVALSVVSRGAGKGSDRTGRKRAGAPAAASASYLTSDAAFSGIEDVLTELDNTFPLAEDY